MLSTCIKSLTFKESVSRSVVSNSLSPHMDCSPPGSSVHRVFQARILEWVAISFSRGSSQPRDWNCTASHVAPTPGDGFFTTEPPGKPTLSSIIKIKCSYIQSKQRWTKSSFNQLKLVLLHAAAAAQNDFYATKKTWFRKISSTISQIKVPSARFRSLSERWA